MRLSGTIKILTLALFQLATFSCLPVSAQVELIDEPELATNLQLPIVEWHDKSANTAGVILAIPGLTLHSKTFDTTARFLAGNGYPTYAIDLRGMGKWRTEPERFNGKSTMDFSLSKADVIRTLQELNGKYPDKPIFCMGESYGATLSAFVAIKKPELVDGIIVSSFCDKRLWKHPMLRMIPDLVRGVSLPFMAVSLRPYTSKLLSPDPVVTRTYLDDPMIVHGITFPRLVKTLAENKHVIRRLDKIQTPILVLSGGKDGTRHPDVMPKYLHKINSQQMKFRSLAKQGHLLLECQPKMNAETASTLQQWLRAQTSRQVASHTRD